MFAHESTLMVQAWRVAHPPVRGYNWMFSRPLVHVGFLRSWLAGAFNNKVVDRTMEVVNSRKPASGKLQILITGRISHALLKDLLDCLRQSNVSVMSNTLC